MASNTQADKGLQVGADRLRNGCLLAPTYNEITKLIEAIGEACHLTDSACE